jgi:hypothetical protein
LRFNLRRKTIVRQIKLKLVALLAGLGLAAFDDMIALTVGTAHRDKYHINLRIDDEQRANLKHHWLLISSPPTTT